jgi:hypothetical protein
MESWWVWLMFEDVVVVKVSVRLLFFSWLLVKRFPILGIATLPHMAVTVPRSGTTECHIPSHSSLLVEFTVAPS